MMWRTIGVQKHGIFITTTRAMEVSGIGCMILVTTVPGEDDWCGDHASHLHIPVEAMEFMPGVKLMQDDTERNEVGAFNDSQIYKLVPLTS